VIPERVLRVVRADRPSNDIIENEVLDVFNNSLDVLGWVVNVFVRDVGELLNYMHVRGPARVSEVSTKPLNHIRHLSVREGHDQKGRAPSNGSRLSCGALKKDVSFNILRAPPASSAC
jgi:hypothetical protein